MSFKVMGILRKIRSNPIFGEGYLKTGSLQSWWKPTLYCVFSTRTMPTLLKQMEDGSEEIIEEDELFEYRRYRWLCDDTENLKMRYRKFNVSAIIDAAIRAVGNGARSCTKLLKCVEGQYNKAFIMTMDTGHECVARIPNPNAGPIFYLTASEVATRHFLREVLKLPVPKILAYSSSNRNPVEAEYIFEEKAEGVPLGKLWYQSSIETQRNIIAQIVEFESKLTSASFRRHGCIYYKDDLEKKNVRSYEIENEIDFSQSFSNDVETACIKDLVIGPITEAKLWEGERETMNLDRGPWSTGQSYMATLGINEIKWAKKHANPRINPRRSQSLPESSDDFISLLERYLQVVPYLAPETTRTTISHHDLHLDNIFVDPKSMQITCVIDWQSTSVCEPWFQQSYPRMLHPIKTAAAQKPSEDYLKGFSNLNEYYVSLTKSRNRQWWYDHNIRDRSLLIQLVSTLCGAWERNDIFSFRDSLIEITARWDEVAKHGEACPIHFTPKELEAHKDESEVLEGLYKVFNQLQNENLLPLGGMVRQESFEGALKINSYVKKMFIDTAQPESQKHLYSRIWPY